MNADTAAVLGAAATVVLLLAGAAVVIAYDTLAERRTRRDAVEHERQLAERPHARPVPPQAADDAPLDVRVRAYWQARGGPTPDPYDPYTRPRRRSA